MAMTLLPPKGQGQVMAVCLLLIVLGALYFVTLHPFVRGHLDVAKQISELKVNEKRFREEMLKKPALEQRLKQIKEFEATNTYFLPETSFDLAAANLSAKIKDVVGANTNTQRCTVVSSQPQHVNSDEPYQRASIQVRLRCDLDDLVKVIHALENATPLMFVDEVNLYQQPIMDTSFVTAQGGNMDARFDLSGYIRVTKEDAQKAEAGKTP
jgi:general secretion pathway protein M